MSFLPVYGYFMIQHYREINSQYGEEPSGLFEIHQYTSDGGSVPAYPGIYTEEQATDILKYHTTANFIQA